MTTKKTVLITGSTDGVGRYIAERLAVERWRVIVHGRDRARDEAGAKRKLSADGFELRFAVNYLAGFLLTRLLMPVLETRQLARIVNVSSAGQRAINFSDVMLTRGYSGVRAYCQSKLAPIMFNFDLAKELAGRNIAVNCLHPTTYMDTTMVRLSGVQPISTVEQGGAAIFRRAGKRFRQQE